ncbi:PREDICTED: vesicle-associated membrane protein 5 isoform X1 [Gekko japonicus]|uniref:Vesicle-associated membrane protein 5 isoform X1 n=1 Tax=Gekko japonicus TaxID=146911 RepID=A0ABM1KXQ4_GEKJA|nr:PREDICTED: vesicle-associated membrane protein 5 isoform X1 [Gekko japonicus]
MQGENHLEQCQKDTEEVTQIMLENYSKVLDREGKLSDLDDRAEELRNQSSAFSKTTKTIAQQQRWKNRKCKIILAAVVIGAVLLLILVIVLALSFGSSGNQEAAAKDSTGGN